MGNGCLEPRGASEVQSHLYLTSVTTSQPFTITSSEIHKFHRNGETIGSQVEACHSPVLLDRDLKWVLPPMTQPHVLGTCPGATPLPQQVSKWGTRRSVCLISGNRSLMWKWPGLSFMGDMFSLEDDKTLLCWVQSPYDQSAVIWILWALCIPHIAWRLTSYWPLQGQQSLGIRSALRKSKIPQHSHNLPYQGGIRSPRCQQTHKMIVLSWNRAWKPGEVC